MEGRREGEREEERREGWREGGRERGKRKGGRRGEEGGRGPPDDHDLVFVEKVQGHLPNLSPRHHHVTPCISHCLHMLQERSIQHTLLPCPKQ